jgi:hypothetical protein
MQSRLPRDAGMGKANNWSKDICTCYPITKSLFQGQPIRVEICLNLSNSMFPPNPDASVVENHDADKSHYAV